MKNKIEINLDQFWSGYCPECELNGKRNRMRLNLSDFYECEVSHLQMVLTAQTHIFLSAADDFNNKTGFGHQMWQTDFIYFKILGWG